MAAGDFDHLLYRRGFVVRPQGQPTHEWPTVTRSWPTVELGEWVLHTDPSVPVSVAGRGARSLALVGSAVNPAAATADPGAIVARLVGAHGDDALLDELDDLVGRFVLVVIDGADAWLTQDAGGTRSVFYTTGRHGTVVASHAPLAADIVGAPTDEVSVRLFERLADAPGVKYLPGLRSPFVGVRPLTPNTRLHLAGCSVERIFPRSSRELRLDLANVAHEVGERLRSTIGLFASGGPLRASLTAGRDSRLTLSAAREVRDQITWFTYVDPEAPVHAVDVAVARDLAARHGLRHEVLEQGTPIRRRADFGDFERVWRANLGLPRGMPALNLAYLMSWPDGATHMPSTVIGAAKGHFRKRLSNRFDPASMAAWWTAALGDDTAVKAFEELVEVTAFNARSLLGFDPSDLFYWEHRLTQWNAWLATEADMSHDTISPYSDRRLLTAILALPRRWQQRHLVHTHVIGRLWPALAEIPVNPSTWPQPVPDPSPKRARPADVEAGRARDRRREGADAVRAGDFATAVALLEEALDLDSQDAMAWYWLARAHFGLLRHGPAARALAQAEHLGAGLQRTSLLRAQLAKAQGTPDEQEAWLKAVAANKRDRSVRFTAASAVAALGDFDTASALLTATRKNDVEDGEESPRADLVSDIARGAARRDELAWRRAASTGRPARSPIRRAMRPTRAGMPDVAALMLIEHSSPALGGYATRSHGLLRGLHQAGVPSLGVTLADHRARPPRFRRGARLERFDDVDYARLPHSRPAGRIEISRTADSLAELVGRYLPKVLHSASFSSSGLAVAETAARTGLPSVYEVRGLYHLARTSRDPQWDLSVVGELEQAAERRACESVDLVLAISAQLRSELIRLGVAPEQIEVLPQAVDAERFRPRPADASLTARLGIEGRTVIGWFGRHARHEGVTDLLRAVRLLVDRGSGREVAVLMAGDGPARRRVGELVSELGLSEVVRHLGAVPHEQVPGLLSVVDVLAVPRRPVPVGEAVPSLRPLEAMAMEKAVLVSSVAVLTDVVQDGETGLVHEKGDVGSLADQLEQLVEDPELRARLGAAAGEWVRAGHTWVDRGRLLGCWYEALADGARPGAAGWPAR